MSARNGAGVTHQSDADAREIDQLGGRVSFVATPECKPFQVIRAELVGDDSYCALGVTTGGLSPLLSLCRLLVERGHDPDRPREAWRGETLCLPIRSIGEAAELDLNGRATGFVKRRQSVGIGPPVAPTAKCLVPPHKQVLLAAREGGVFFTPTVYRRSS